MIPKNCNNSHTSINIKGHKNQQYASAQQLKHHICINKFVKTNVQINVGNPSLSSSKNKYSIFGIDKKGSECCKKELNGLLFRKFAYISKANRIIKILKILIPTKKDFFAVTVLNKYRNIIYLSLSILISV
jgi:hypothetical protein